MDVQAVIVPGVGVAACQAGVDNTRENQMLVYDELKKGTPPAADHRDAEGARGPTREPDRAAPVRDPRHAQRRDHHRRGTTAPASTAAATRRRRSTSAARCGDIYYQVQGNTLLGDDVVMKAALAFTRATGTMADRVMAAMEAADANGGDHRCNCGNNPLDFVPCDDKTAHVAYIAIAEKTDTARRHAQRREVLRLPQRDRRQHAEGRERQPREDAAPALRRLEEGRAPNGPPRPGRASTRDGIRLKGKGRRREGRREKAKKRASAFCLLPCLPSAFCLSPFCLLPVMPPPLLRHPI